MKILFINAIGDKESGGGAEVVVWEQMKGLRDAGHECVLAATGPDAGLENEKHDGISVWKAELHNVYWPFHDTHPAAPIRFLWHVRDIYNRNMQRHIEYIVDKEKPDVASVHNLPGWSIAVYETLWRLNVPIVQVLHDYYFICIKSNMYGAGNNCKARCELCKLFRVPHKKRTNKVQAVVAVSNYVLKKYDRFGYFSDVPIRHVIHNACASRVEDEDTAKICDQGRGVRFGYIGRLDAAKGIESLIDAFLNARIASSELWIAGVGKAGYVSRLRAVANDDRIHFLGQTKPSKFYPNVDVVIVPSKWNEPLGMVVMEALSFGKPVVGATRGGIPEMIRDGENGLLFEPTSEGALIECLRRFAEDKVLRNKLTATSKLSSLPFTDMKAWINSYESLYRDVIDKGVVVAS